MLGTEIPEQGIDTKVGLEEACAGGSGFGFGGGLFFFFGLEPVVEGFE
jgi:hypothetical protein